MVHSSPNVPSRLGPLCVFCVFAAHGIKHIGVKRYHRPMQPLTLPPLVRASGRAPAEVRAGRPFMLYFSAHWCGPCRQTTPRLIEEYRGARAPEVIFVSSDRDESSFNEYASTMPWLAVPFSSAARQALQKRFDVKGIPRLVVCDANGYVNNFRATAEDWKVPLPLVANFSVSATCRNVPVGMAPTAMLLGAADDEAAQQFTEAAAKHPEMLFVDARNSNGPAAQLAAALHQSVRENTALLVLKGGDFHVPAQGDKDVGGFIDTYTTAPVLTRASKNDRYQRP